MSPIIVVEYTQNRPVTGFEVAKIQSRSQSRQDLKSSHAMHSVDNNVYLTDSTIHTLRDFRRFMRTTKIETKSKHNGLRGLRHNKSTK